MRKTKETSVASIELSEEERVSSRIMWLEKQQKARYSRAIIL